MKENERVEADDDYIGEHPAHVKCPKGFANLQMAEYMQQRVRNRQETVNKRFKDWGCLRVTWRSDLSLHGDAFRLIAIVTQLVTINNREKLFECGYRDLPYNDEDNAEEDNKEDDEDL